VIASKIQQPTRGFDHDEFIASVLSPNDWTVTTTTTELWTSNCRNAD